MTAIAASKFQTGDVAFPDLDPFGVVNIGEVDTVTSIEVKVSVCAIIKKCTKPLPTKKEGLVLGVWRKGETHVCITPTVTFVSLISLKTN